MVLATWRIASLFAVEPGPWDVFGRVRQLGGVRYGEDGLPYGTNELSRGLVCVWCNSIWIGLVLAVAHYLKPGVTFWLALPFALSAGAVIIQEINDGVR